MRNRGTLLWILAGAFFAALAAKLSYADVAVYGGVPATPSGVGVKVADGTAFQNAAKTDSQGKTVIATQDSDQRRIMEDQILRQGEGMISETQGTAYNPPIEIR